MWCRDILCYTLDENKQNELFAARYSPSQYTFPFIIFLIAIGLMFSNFFGLFIVKVVLSFYCSHLTTEWIVKHLSYQERFLRFQAYREQLKFFINDGKEYYKIFDNKTNLEWVKIKPLEKRPRGLYSALIFSYYFLFLFIF